MDTTKTYVECGCCGHYHLDGYTGDCRDDIERFTWVNLMNAEVPQQQIIDLEY